MTGAGLGSIGLEFQPFLYAQIGDDSNGVPLSVLSALARQNIDPWEQAAHWSRLTPKSAIRELTDMIAALPLGPKGLPSGDAAQVPAEIAMRLVALLPNMPSAVGRAPAAAAAPALDLGAHPVITRRMKILIFCVLCGLLGQWLFGVLNDSAPLDDAQAPHATRAPAPGSPP